MSETQIININEPIYSFEIIQNEVSIITIQNTFNFQSSLSYFSINEIIQVLNLNANVYNIFSLIYDFQDKIKHALKNITLSFPLTKLYPPLSEQLETIPELESAKIFIPDYLTLRFIMKNSGLTADDVLLSLVSLANILRYADLHGVNEIFVGPFKFVKGKSTWILATY